MWWSLECLCIIVITLLGIVNYFVVDMMIDVVGVVALGLSLHYSFHSTGDSEVFCCGRDG